MVRPARVGRSRGCQPCRTRRIKCDLKEPHCQRCIDSGRECPGPLTGVLVIQAQQTPSGRMRGKLLPPVQNDSRRLSSSATQQLQVARMPAQVSQASLYEENLLSRFLEFLSHAARRSSWTLKLPHLKDSPGAHALRSSLRAVSLAYFAHSTQNSSARLESLHYYGQSLTRQRNALIELPLARPTRPDTITCNGLDLDAATNTLLATVILSYFELISPSSTDQNGASSAAWLHHTLAAERLIVMLGTQSLSNDIIGQLFFSIRSHAVHRAAVLGHYTVFSKTEWLQAAAGHVPKQSYARSSYDRVTEVILRISRLKFRRKQEPYIPITDDETTFQPDGSEDDNPCELFEETLQKYATFLRCCQGLTTDDMPLYLPHSQPPTSRTSSPSPPHERPPFAIKDDDANRKDTRDIRDIPDPLYSPFSTAAQVEASTYTGDLHPKLRKVFAAMTTAYYHAAAILLHSHFPEMRRQPPHGVQILEEETPEPSPPGQDDWPHEWKTEPVEPAENFHDWDITHNARTIVAAGRFLSPPGKSNGTAVLRMMLPFSVVWHHCRESALETDEAHASMTTDGSAAGRCDVRRNEMLKVRLEARELFAEWCGREGMKGLMGVGFAEPIGPS